MFEHVQPYAGDPIFALVDAYNADPRPAKVNLSIGIYFDEQGRLPVLPSVQLAEARILAAAGPKPYLPMEGDAACRAEVAKLLLGSGHPAIAAGRVATIQTVGSSGGLKVGADFLKTWLPDAAVWVSDPTWDNHRSMFEGSGFQVHNYPYFDAASGGLRFDAMLDTLRGLPKRSIVLLHACCRAASAQLILGDIVVYVRTPVRLFFSAGGARARVGTVTSIGSTCLLKNEQMANVLDR